MKSSQFYFKEANDALFIVAHAPNAYAVESSDYFNQVELTKGLMLFGKDKVSLYILSFHSNSSAPLYSSLFPGMDYNIILKICLCSIATVV